MATITTDKLIIGLTGNIATGKSAVLRLAVEKGALAIDADKLVHDLMDHDADMQSTISLAFGPEVRREDGRIDRAALGKIVFQDAEALRDLEMMIHPAVRRTIFEQVGQSEAPIVMIEAIKLLEGDLSAACDQIWVTRCSPKRQMQRLIICRGLDQETARQRIEAQPPQAEKVAQADVVIDTDGLMRDTETQFELAWNRLPQLDEVAAKTLTLPDEPAPFAGQTGPLPTRPTPRSATGRSALTPAAPLPPVGRPEDLDIRRARPSDIPAILLLMQQATDGQVKMKRADLLLALGERSYFIGQRGADVKAVFGWNIESLVASVDQVYIHPPEETAVVGAAILEEIEASADQHLGEIVVVFLPPQAGPELRQLLAGRQYNTLDFDTLPKMWQLGIKEHQPEGTDFFIRILRRRVTQAQ
jgi:dephospho-CoA kinase